jgi:hypothetical protein
VNYFNLFDTVWSLGRSSDEVEDDDDRGRGGGIAQQHADDYATHPYGSSDRIAEEEDGGADDFWNLTAAVPQNVPLSGGAGLRRASPLLQSADDLLKRMATHESAQHPMAQQDSVSAAQHPHEDSGAHSKPKRYVAALCVCTLHQCFGAGDPAWRISTTATAVCRPPICLTPVHSINVSVKWFVVIVTVQWRCMFSGLVRKFQ